MLENLTVVQLGHHLQRPFAWLAERKLLWVFGRDELVPTEGHDLRSKDDSIRDRVTRNALIDDVLELFWVVNVGPFNDRREISQI